MGMIGKPQRGFRAFADPFKEQPFGCKVVNTPNGRIEAPKYYSTPAGWAARWVGAGVLLTAVLGAPIETLRQGSNSFKEAAQKDAVLIDTALETFANVGCEIAGPVCDHVGAAADGLITGEAGVDSPNTVITVPNVANTVITNPNTPTTVLSAEAAAPGSFVLKFTGGEKACSQVVQVQLLPGEGQAAAVGRANGLPATPETGAFRMALAARSLADYPANAEVDQPGESLTTYLCK